MRWTSNVLVVVLVSAVSMLSPEHMLHLAWGFGILHLAQGLMIASGSRRRLF